MPKYRKKPVEIDAERFSDESVSGRLAEWCGGSNEDRPDQIQIPTLEGTMTAQVGDWIIKGVQGEFYPCKPDIFAQLYTRAD